MIGRFLTGRANHLDVASACLTSAGKSEIIDSPSRVNPIALNAHINFAKWVVKPCVRDSTSFADRIDQNGVRMPPMFNMQLGRFEHELDFRPAGKKSL